MTNQIPPSLQRFGPELDAAAHRELPRFEKRQGVHVRGMAAGATLGLAGLGTALVLALGSGATAAPAFAVTPQGDGTVLVSFNQQQSVTQADAKLLADGDHEIVAVNFQPGAALTSGAVDCTAGSGVTGPPVQLLLGSDGTQVISAGNTGAGSWHVAGCVTGVPGSDPDAGGQPQTATAVAPSAARSDDVNRASEPGTTTGPVANPLSAGQVAGNTGGNP